MKEFLANLVAAVLAAATGAGVVVGVSLVLAGQELYNAAWNTAPMIGMAALVLSLFSLMPICVLLQYARRFGFRTAALSGLLVGAAVPAVLAIFNGGLGDLAAIALLCIGAGGLAGLIYYLVYRGLRPNNSFKPKPLRGSA